MKYITLQLSQLLAPLSQNKEIKTKNADALAHSSSLAATLVYDMNDASNLKDDYVHVKVSTS